MRVGDVVRKVPCRHSFHQVWEGRVSGIFFFSLPYIPRAQPSGRFLTVFDIGWVGTSRQACIDRWLLRSRCTCPACGFEVYSRFQQDGTPAGPDSGVIRERPRAVESKSYRVNAPPHDGGAAAAATRAGREAKKQKKKAAAAGSAAGGQNLSSLIVTQAAAGGSKRPPPPSGPQAARGGRPRPRCRRGPRLPPLGRAGASAPAGREPDGTLAAAQLRLMGLALGAEETAAAAAPAAGVSRSGREFDRRKGDGGARFALPLLLPGAAAPASGPGLPLSVGPGAGSRPWPGRAADPGRAKTARGTCYLRLLRERTSVAAERRMLADATRAAEAAAAA
ncbi:MAG: hypothetical protein BJ554DRAFT_5030, partial [Olpidium bornovanus]